MCKPNFMMLVTIDFQYCQKKVANADNSVTQFLLSKTRKKYLNFQYYEVILWEILGRDGIYELVLILSWSVESKI